MIGFTAFMAILFSLLVWNVFTLSSLYCTRANGGAVRCQVGYALLSVREWEQREDLPGELLSTSIATHRGSRSTSYAVMLHTTETSAEWAHSDSSFAGRQALANQIETHIDSVAEAFELHEQLDTSDLLLATGLLAIPFFFSFLIRIEQLTLDAEARTIRSLQRGLWQHEDKTFGLADLREVRVDQKKGSKGGITYSLVLSFAGSDPVTIANVGNKQAQAAKQRIEKFLAHP